jgi:hypothetical protein
MYSDRLEFKCNALMKALLLALHDICFSASKRGYRLLCSAARASLTQIACTRKQIAPTILNALGLDATQLQGAVAEGTQSLPGI